MNSTDISSELNIEKWLLFWNNLKHVDYLMDRLVGCFMGLILCTSVIGNSLTCFVIWSNKSMHTATNYYLFNLAVSDLILTFAIPLEIIDILGSTADSLIYCRLAWFLVSLLWNNGILTMTALAIERFVAICYPLLLEASAPAVYRRVVKVIALVWVVAMAETVLEIMTIGLIKTDKAPVCFVIPTASARLIIGVVAIFTFAIPLIVMAFAYSMIVFKVNTLWMEKAGDHVFNQVDARPKTNKLVIAITVSFLVCWMPFFTSKMLICLLDVDQLLQLPLTWSYWYYVVVISGWMSIVVNPVLYNLMSKKFRDALKIHWNAVIKK